MTDQEKALFRDWWRLFSPDADTEGKPKDRAHFARLRRCATPLDAMLEPATHELLTRNGVTAPQIPRGEACAVIAVALAHVREDLPEGRFAQRLGEGDPPLLSRLRFNRLLRANTGAERIAAFRRALRATKHKANVEELGRGLWSLSSEGRWREREIADWTFAYFGAATPSQPKQGNDA